MSELQNNSGSGQDDREGKVKLVDAKKSDAASVNERDTERMLEASEASEPSYELHLDDNTGEHPSQNRRRPKEAENQGTTNADKGRNTDVPKGIEHMQESKEAGEELGGTTNLSLEQLKKEGDPEGEV